MIRESYKVMSKVQQKENYKRMKVLIFINNKIGEMSHLCLLSLCAKFKFYHESLLTWDRVSFWTILSFPTLILRVDKANLSSPASHPIKLATLCRPESKTSHLTLRACEHRLNKKIKPRKIRFIEYFFKISRCMELRFNV